MDQLTETVEQRANAQVRTNLDTHDERVAWGDWSDRGLADRYRHRISNSAAWAVADYRVAATSQDGADYAAVLLDQAVGDLDMPDTARIDILGPEVAVLTW